jgi:hypothetical protein
MSHKQSNPLLKPFILFLFFQKYKKKFDVINQAECLITADAEYVVVLTVDAHIQRFHDTCFL